MKKLIGFLTIFLLLCYAPLYAANIYIRQGATGTTGADWGVNALGQLPATLIRGNIYYIADGDYVSYEFNDAESGTTYITIKKATASDHGTETGWLSSYGDGQAVFSNWIRFTTGYYIWDGLVGSGSDASSYGFKVEQRTCTWDSAYMIGLPAVGQSLYQLDHITITHTAVVACGIGDGTKGQSCIYGSSGGATAPTDITLSNNYFYNGTNAILIRGAQRWTITDNYFAGNWSTSAEHGQQISNGNTKDITLANNIFKNSATFVIGAHNESGGSENWNVYNNIIIGQSSLGLSAVFAMAESAEYNGLLSSKFHHNTFVGVSCGARGAVYVGLQTDASIKSYAYNNLFYNCTTPRLDNADGTAGVITHDYNAYLSCTGTINSADEANPQRNDSATDPFVNSAGGDYHLLSGVLAINNGVALDVKYSSDVDLVSRPQGAAWDMGAYEYTSGGDITPPTLSSVAIAMNGIDLAFSYSEAVAGSPTSDLCSAYSVSTSTQGAITLSYVSGNGTSPVICTSNKTILTGETITAGMDYTQPGNGIEDLSGNDLASIDNKAVTNNSAQYAPDNDVPTVSSATLNTTGYLITVVFPEAVTVGGINEWTVTPTRGHAEVVGITGSGTDTLTLSLNRTIFESDTETLTLSYTQPGNGVEDIVGNDLATITNMSVTNGSAVELLNRKANIKGPQ